MPSISFSLIAALWGLYALCRVVTVCGLPCFNASIFVDVRCKLEEMECPGPRFQFRVQDYRSISADMDHIDR